MNFAVVEESAGLSVNEAIFSCVWAFNNKAPALLTIFPKVCDTAPLPSSKLSEKFLLNIKVAFVGNSSSLKDFTAIPVVPWSAAIMNVCPPSHWFVPVFAPSGAEFHDFGSSTEYHGSGAINVISFYPLPSVMSMPKLKKFSEFRCA